MNGTILVTGAGGMLGRDLVAAAKGRGWNVAAFTRAGLDVSDEAAVRCAVSEAHPTVIVNCAAFTRVDDCEIEEARARLVNGDSVAVLSRAANEVSALLVQVSTDFVFDGRSTVPYREDDETSPVSAYGRSKLLGEENARLSKEHLIVRTSWLYGLSGWNFIEALRKQIDAGKNELNVVDDQVGSPTSATDLADAILDLIAAGARGIVHFSNSGSVSWFGYAKEISRRLGWKAQVWPISSEMLARPARRPAHSVLDTSRYTGMTGRTPRLWTEPLAEYLDHSRS